MEKHPKAEQINQSPLGLRPYADTAGGYVQKMRRVTDRALEYMVGEYKAFMAQSEFKKPYKSPTYEDMEYGKIPPIPDSPDPPPVPPGPTPPEPTPPGPKPPIPGPGPTPPGPPIYNVYRCQIWDFFFCPGGPAVPIPIRSFGPNDPIAHIGFAVGGGDGSEGHISGGGGYGTYIPGTGNGMVSIMAFTQHGAECIGFGYAKDPDECQDCKTPSIGYTTTSMNVGESQQLSVVGGGSGLYTWTVSGGGSITPGGLYTAPSSNANCSGNPTIGLSCGGHTVATLSIAINGWTGNDVAYSVVSISGAECIWSMAAQDYKCNGTTSGSSQPCSGCDASSHPADCCLYPHGTYGDPDYVCGPPQEYCNSGWPPIHCGGHCLDIDQCIPGTKDLRTSAMLTGGCCPAALM